MPEEYINKLIRRSHSRDKWRQDRKAAEKILRYRRERYANDPEYQKSIKESVKRQRSNKEPSRRKRSFNRDKISIVNGMSVLLLSSGKAAHLLDISPRTLKNWDKMGRIPQNSIKDRLGRCWYPAEFIVFLGKQMKNKKNISLNKWSEQVEEAWQTVQLSNNPIPVI
jgi:hypothetical protein